MPTLYTDVTILETSVLQESCVPSPSCHKWITDADRRQFHEDGYMVIRGVIPAPLAQNAVCEIVSFMGANLDDSTTWYSGAPELDGIVPLHHAQSLWDIRQCPDLHRVFSEFFGQPQLIVDINRCIFRPPIHRLAPTVSYGSIHWDTDPRIKRPDSLQAVVLLSDVGPNAGGFQCIPDVYRNLDAWLEQYASRDDFNFFEPGLNRCTTIEVQGSGRRYLVVDPAAARHSIQLVAPPQSRVIRFHAATAARQRRPSRVIEKLVDDKTRP